VISLIWHGREFFFEGVCDGVIEEQYRGIEGFGYDPVFTPHKSSKTFAEMTIEEKGIYSHRRLATDQLVSFLRKEAGKIH
jgi:XTP/dITP diphosphohydrolase